MEFKTPYNGDSSAVRLINSKIPFSRDLKLANTVLVGSRRSKATLAPICLGQCVQFHQFRIQNLFANELSDAVTLLHLEWHFGMVEQNDANVSAVVLVNNTSANIDEVLNSQARARGNATICSFGHFHLDIGFDQLLAMGWDYVIVGTASEKCEQLRGECLGEVLLGLVSVSEMIHYIPAQIIASGFVRSSGWGVSISRQFGKSEGALRFLQHFPIEWHDLFF